MKEIEIIKTKVDISRTKILSFLAIAGGSWVYVLKDDLPFLLKIAIWLVFAGSIYGTSNNLIKLGKLNTKLEELE